VSGSDRHASHAPSCQPKLPHPALVWPRHPRAKAKSGDLSEPAFMEELQKRMEVVVLGLQSGSYAQRVQAEYLKEVEARAKTVFKQLAEVA
jgi:hypothetical protein